MAGFEEALSTQKFLLCIPLRAGSLIILWWSFFSSLGFYIYLCSIMSNPQKGISNEYTVLLLFFSMIISASGCASSGGALYYFPDPHSTNHMTKWMGCIKVDKAKQIRGFARYNIATVIYFILLLVIIAGTMSNSDPTTIAFRNDLNLNYGNVFKATVLLIFLSGIHLHFAAVVYSFYKSII